MPTITYKTHRDDREKEIALAKLRERQHRETVQETATARSNPATKPGSKLKKAVKIVIGTIFILIAIIAGIYVCKENSYEQNASIAMTFVFGLAITVLQYRARREKQIQTEIMQNSVQYKALLALNNEMLAKRLKIHIQPNTCHYEIANGTILIKAYHKCRSKKQFDQINTTKLAQNYIYRDYDFFNESMKIKAIETNLAIQYGTRVDEIRNRSDYNQLPKEYQEKITLEKYKKYIQELIQANLISFTTNIKFILRYSYTSPQGRNHYSDYETFYEDEIWEYIKNNSKRPAEATNHISETFKQRQRSLMTNKLRYKILQRDNHRCVLCGRTAQESIAASGYGLEIDHIIPVSKGGKTIESNLRTLCFACNRGKGADIEKNTA